MRCFEATYIASQRFTSLLFIALYNIVFLHQTYSCPPPPLLTLRSSTLPISTSLEVTLFSFTLFTLETEVTNLKNKKFFFLLLLSCHSKLCLYLTYQYSSLSTVTLPYPNLTWLLSSFGVKLDNGVVPYAPHSPPRFTVFNRHPLYNNLSYVQRLTGWSSTSQPLSRHILLIDIQISVHCLPYIYQPPFHCWVAIPGYMAYPLLGSSYPAC